MLHSHVIKPALGLAALLAGLLAPVHGQAQGQAQPQATGPLIQALGQARSHDALYQQARAEREFNTAQADMAGTAYFPQLQATAARSELENSERRTLTLSQPLISAERYTTWREETPRQEIASATFEAREHDLGLRLLRAVAELLRQHEGLRLNRAKIEALEKQSQSAQRAFQLGQGTVTDVRDAQVRLEQARAETLLIDAQLGAALRQISNITGVPSEPLRLDVPRMARNLNLRALDDYLAPGVQRYPQLRLARLNQRLAELGLQRADWVYLPNVNAVLVQTSIAGRETSYTGVSVTLPLQASSYYQRRSAAANAVRADESTRDAELKVRLEVQRLWALVGAGIKETEIRLEAIRSAELSVEANERSFRGGVRSQIDVLNSIQTLYQVQQEYVTSVLALADNYLQLLLLAATPLDEAVAQAQLILFPVR